MSKNAQARARRQPVARHGVLSSPNPFVQILTVLGAMLAVVVVSAGAVGAYAVWDARTALADSGVSINPGKDGAEAAIPDFHEIKGGVNMLVVGTDSCEGQDIKIFPRCAHDTGGERNDVTMLVHISDAPRRVTVVSFPRDMLVPIPSCTAPDGTRYSAMSSQMMNASYEYGGVSCTVATVEALTGVDIQFAAAIRWTGVINMSDAIGGVKVCVASAINDRHTGLHLTAGEHTLTGTKALQFLRIRHGIGDGSDLARISNQQQFMSSMIRKLQSQDVLANPATLLNLASTAMKQVTGGQLVLSKSLADPTRMAQIAMAVKSVPYKDIVFVQYPTAYAAEGSRVLPVTSAADVLFAALAKNKPVKLTGNASSGYGVEVTGEIPDGSATTTPTPGGSGTASPTATATGTATPTPSATDVVDLPAGITGQTAAEQTCTLAQQ